MKFLDLPHFTAFCPLEEDGPCVRRLTRSVKIEHILNSTLQRIKVRPFGRMSLEWGSAIVLILKTRFPGDVQVN
jgi:hypothetical protein